MRPTRIHGIASAWVACPARLPSQQMRTINGNPCCCPDIIPAVPACTRKWHFTLPMHGIILPHARDRPNFEFNLDALRVFLPRDFNGPWSSRFTANNTTELMCVSFIRKRSLCIAVHTSRVSMTIRKAPSSLSQSSSDESRELGYHDETSGKNNYTVCTHGIACRNFISDRGFWVCTKRRATFLK